MRAGSRGRFGLAVALALAAAAAGCVPRAGERPLTGLVGTLASDSTLVGCERAAQRIVLDADAHLDPACIWTGGIEIRSSDVVLDCRGARIEDPSGTQGRGIYVAAPATTPLADVTVRNCIVRGFLNNVRVSREGFRALAAGAEYENGFSNVVVENSHLYASRGSGVFVDAYVSGVTLRGLDIADSGGVGIYLEAGSKGGRVEDSTLRGNGYGDVVPEGIPFDLGGVAFRYRSTGREGIAVDGSRDNVIAGNVIEGSSAGGIFLYKNCGEFVTERPSQWWPRRYGADGNRIEGNLIRDEGTAIWIGSRMAENQLFMDCSDPAYVDAPFLRLHRDFAADNVVAGNTIVDFDQGVRIEDDRNRVEDNTFLSERPGAQAILLGTWRRTEILREPVAGAVIRGNVALLPAGRPPFGWIHGHVGTTYTANLRQDPATGAAIEEPLAAGVQPTVNPFLFVLEVWPGP